jgi:hypothetical protein
MNKQDTHLRLLSPTEQIFLYVAVSSVTSRRTVKVHNALCESLECIIHKLCRGRGESAGHECKSRRSHDFQCPLEAMASGGVSGEWGEKDTLLHHEIELSVRRMRGKDSYYAILKS